MAKNDNVKDFCKDIADAIRAKKGTSDLINPQDFSAEIKSISGGGGSEGGGESNIEYLDVRDKNLMEWGELLPLTSVLIKKPTKIITPSMMIFFGETANDSIAFAIYPTLEFDWQGTRTNVADFCRSMGVDISTYPRLTKEQFYSLE